MDWTPEQELPRLAAEQVYDNPESLGPPDGTKSLAA
jgi:hypothetical protein